MIRHLLLLLAFVACVFGHEGEHEDHLHDSGSRSCAAHDKSTELMNEDMYYKRGYDKQVQHSLNHQKEMREQRKKLKKDLEKLNIQKQVLERKMAHAKAKGLSEDRVNSAYKSLNDEYNKLERRRLATANSNSYSVVTIPVVFHVLYTNSNENLSNNQLQSQIDVLNADFRGLNSEIVNGEVDSMWDDRLGDSKLEFSLAQVNRVSISSSSICDSESYMKKTSGGGSDAWDPETYLNIWICPLSSYLGYAYYPCLLGGSSEWKDGVVITSSAVGSRDDDDGSFYFGGYSYDLGRTGTHEVGHYLNLAHVWGSSSSCSVDDGVDDTPTSYTSNFGCPSGTDSCDTTDPLKGYDLRDNYENYMDYSNDACMFMFTDEQVDRMRAVVSSSGCRSTMYNNGNDGGGDDSSGSGDDSDDDTTDDGEFTCNDGCGIPAEYQSDGYCDCSSCEDESSWTCSSCGGCPSYCGDYVYCTGTSTCPDGYFCCDDGCEVSASYESDGWCDCSNCEDEASYTCSSCDGGCPDYCGGWGYCGSAKEAEAIVAAHRQDVESADSDEIFTCDDGCEIDIDWAGDDYCDCSDCEDEEFWTCENCMSWDDPSGNYYGCPNEDDCDDYRFCDRFICPTKDDNGDECNVRQVHLNNGWCDCPGCEDEDDWTCDTCGGCVDECISPGGYGHQCSRAASDDGEGDNTDGNIASAYARNKEKELEKVYGKSSNSNSNSDDNGVVIGVSIAAAIVVIFIIIAIVVVMRKRSVKSVSFKNSSISNESLLNGNTNEEAKETIGISQTAK